MQLSYLLIDVWRSYSYCHKVVYSARLDDIIAYTIWRNDFISYSSLGDWWVCIAMRGDFFFIFTESYLYLSLPVEFGLILIYYEW